MRAILIDPASRTVQEIACEHPAHTLGTQSIRDASITPPGWVERFGQGERAISALSPGDGAFRIAAPACNGIVFRGRTLIVGGNIGGVTLSSLIELSVMKSIIKWGEK